MGRTIGVAPPLEMRIEALVDHAAALGATRLVVAAPDNAYGRRAAKAIRALVEGRFPKPLIIQIYPPSTTSFAPTLAPVLPALGKGAALLVPDHLSRVELIVRQLARAGLSPSPDASAGPVVLSTAEGVTADALGTGHEVLEGLWVCPVAVEHDVAASFVAAFTRAEGRPPDDQALLVYYALRQALLGDSGGNLRPAVGRIQGGRIVRRSSQAP